MTDKPNQLYRIEKDEAARAGEVLADAFKEDPLWRAVFADSPPEQIKAFFETPVRYCIKYGEVYAPSAKIEGVAAWIPGQYSEMTFWRMIASGSFWSSMKSGQEMVRQYQKIFEPIEQDRREYMGENPYIYLYIIGVARQHQGKGYGRMLLEGLIEKSENQGLPIYLETETEDNARMYERFGFEIIQVVQLPLVDLPMWEMVRYPQ